MKITKIVSSIISIFMVAVFLSGCSTINNITNKIVGKDVDNKLLFGIEYDNVEMINEALKDGANINDIGSVLSSESNPVAIALKGSKTEIAKYLIKRGADVNYYDKDGSSLLIYLTSNCDFDMCKFLIKHGAKVNKAEKDGDTALDYAVRSFREENKVNNIMTLLINNGAKIRPKDLKMALENSGLDGDVGANGNYGVVNRILKYLVKHGCKSGLNPAFGAAILGDSYKLDNLIKTNKIKKKYEKQILFYTAAFGKVETMKLLSNKGIDKSNNEYGNAPLAIASIYGNLEMVKYLLSKSVNIDAQNTHNESALVLAVRNNKYDVAKYLIEKGADIKPLNIFPDTIDVLSEAASNGNIDMMKLIVEHGYPLNKENMGRSMSSACDHNKVTALKYLLDNGADINLIYKEATLFSYANTLGTVKFLVEHGAKVVGKDEKGRRIQFGFGYEDIRISRYLINKGADVNQAPKNGASPLMGDIIRGKFDDIKLLVGNGADLEYQSWTGEKNDDNDKDTAIITAAENGSKNILKYLIQKGAKINYQNVKGETPLMRAAAIGLIDNVKILLKYHANKNLKNKAGKTALDIAKDKGNDSIIEILEK